MEGGVMIESEHGRGAPDAIRMEGISKYFGNVAANEGVQLSVRAGEIHALLGENGAGKSTLMNMLSGIYRPDSGSIFVFGEEAHFTSPKDSIRMGIGMIHQHFKLVDVMSARDNIALGRAFRKAAGVQGKGDLSSEIIDISERYGLGVDPGKKVYEMSVGEKQTLEIIKVLYRGAKILIMDEPTAVLTPQEIEKLFSIMRNLRAQGCAVVIITHKLNEVMEISDRITILRGGRSVDTVVTAETTVPALIEKMVGKSVDLKIPRPAFPDRQPLMEVRDLTVRDGEGKTALDAVSFTLHKHEILGVAGVTGSGQKELCESLAGLMKAGGGSVLFEGQDILGRSAKEIIRLGIRLGFIPEDRLGMGLVASMDITDNVILKDYRQQPGLFLSRKPGAEKARRIVERLDVSTPGITTPVGKLSGGNIQKVLLGREIDSDPRVLITAYPVRGLDIGATHRIYGLLNEQKERGVGIIFIGEDLDVLIELCDRILVLADGKCTGILDAASTTKEQLGYRMTGADGTPEEAGRQVHHG
ncbi:MAG: ABC transporter ATP-binding protein [Clostridiales Family XIII bacterium]|jgi:simple sugar transport system ATP-binding protein|nr:ABC transporter ATP-binding protein [Clostridiales Family XIII bacterium]